VRARRTTQIRRWWTAQPKELRRGIVGVSPALTLGLIYLVVYAFGMSYSELAVPHEAGTLPRSTLVPVLIVMFPLFVPTTLGRAAVASVAAATTGPLAAVAYSRLGGTPIPPPSEFVFAYLLNYGAVLLALVPTAIMRHMNREVSSAHRLGSYELKELIGRGGMGEVWHATHNALKRPAALKLIRQDAFGTGSGGDYATAVKRFEREAQATAALHSCHTVQVYDFGTTREGTFFYVMELLNGLDLDTLVNRYGPIPAERVAYLIRQVAESLWDAHEADLIHRDIKPANIYVCRFGHKADTVKVLDFGLVKHTGGLLGDQTKLTKLGSTTGTPAYMSPEMALGESVVDGRADIYALGCVAYWLLTGQLLFPEDTAMKMALAHVREAPQRPSERTELPIPAELEELVMAMLAKDPGDRPSSAEEVIRRIDAIRFESDWSWRRAQSWWDKHNPVPQRAMDVGEAREQRTVAEVVPAIG
jgi:serine/threonine-protein kinase